MLVWELGTIGIGVEVFAKWVFFVSSFVCQFAKDHKEEDEGERGPSLIVNPLTPLGFLLLCLIQICLQVLFVFAKLFIGY